MATITSANSTFALAVTGIFPAPQFLQGYAADDAFTADAIDMAETVIGVDGQMSAGFVFNVTPMTITLMPTSPSLILFEAWTNTQKAQQEVYRCDGVIRLPSIGRSYILKNGVLKQASQFPAVKKTLQPMTFQIVWQSIISEPV